jgi:hypothetical protein
MSRLSRPGFLFVCLAAALLTLTHYAAEPAQPTGDGSAEERFKDWPAPDETSIEYLASIDLRTGYPHVPDEEVKSERLDLLGNNLPPGAVVRLCGAWGVVQIGLSPDGRTVATVSHACGPGGVRVYQTATGLPLCWMGEGRGIYFGLAFSPDGKILATARGGFTEWHDDQGVISFWDPVRGIELDQFGEGTGPRALAFSPDGKTLASGGGDGILWLWDVDSLEALRKIGEHSGLIQAVAFSPDGKLLASAGREGKVRLWNVADGKMIRSIDVEAPSLAFSPDGKTLAAGKALWDVATGKELPQFRGNTHLGLMAFSSDGRTLATYDGTGIHLWETATGKERRWYQLEDAAAEARSLLFTPDSRRLVSADRGWNALVWDVTGLDRPGQPLEVRLGSGRLESLAEDLGGPSPSRAYDAIWSLALAPRQGVPMLREQLRQRPAAPPDAARVLKLVAELDNDRFAVRERASSELARMGRHPEKLLREVLAKKPALEVRQRVERLLTSIEEYGGLDPTELLGCRCLEVLELSQSPEALVLLRELADSKPQPALAVQARAALERHSRRSSIKGD